MSRIIMIGWLFLFLNGAGASTQSVLSVCLPANGETYSFKEGNYEGGFDLRLVEAIARQLQAKLDVTWFEFDDDDESLYLAEVAALISSGVCDVIPGFPIIQELLSGGGCSTIFKVAKTA